MDTIRITLDVLVLIGLVSAGLFVKSYFPSYFQEKAKNLATKEDIGTITQTVEEVKARHTQEIEQLKTALQRESEALGKRRAVYDELVHGLRVFTSGHSAPQTSQAASDFMAAYRHAWIWAPDDVIRKFNEIIDLNRLEPDLPKSDHERYIREAYVAAIVSMRRDAGHAGTKLTAADYRFFSF
jgi:hypothetical protein